MRRLTMLLMCGLFGVAVAAEPAPCRPKALCERASLEVERLLRESGAEGASIIVDVNSGAVVAFASTAPEIGMTTELKPLSLTKLFIGQQWWDHCGEKCGDDAELRTMIANSRDLAGRQIAEELRGRVGPERLLHELSRAGFPNEYIDGDVSFAYISPRREERNSGEDTISEISTRTTAEDWGKAFSIGEIQFTVTLAQLVSYMQTIGNDGTRWPLILRTENDRAQSSYVHSSRVMSATTARKLQGVMRQTVTEGTAHGVRHALKNGWTLGGKTGTRFEGDQPAEALFAGLAWDAKGKARYGFVTYMRHAGRGGEKPAQVSAEAINKMMELMN